MITPEPTRGPQMIPITPEVTLTLIAIAIAISLFMIYLIHRKGQIDEHAKEGATHRIRYNLTAKESENLLKNAGISFAIMLILGYILPVPYNGFTLLGTAAAFMLLGWRSKK